MKKFLLSVLAATTLFAACTTESTTDAVSVPVPDVLTVSLEEDTRMQLMDEKTVWNEGDLVSVFYKSNANQQWKFNGVTGDRIGELSQVEPGVASAPMEKVVVVYPYNANYLITPSTGAVETTLPAEQSYLENSYGIGSSMLIASGYYTQFTFKNVMGWLKLQLTGDGEKVTKVVFRGNDGEQVAGNVYVNADDASLVLSSAEADEGEEGSVNGNLNFENSVVTELTLNCDEVTLGAEATSFYLALPPQVFEKGFTVDIWALDAEENELKMTAKSEGLLAIERNAIQPLEAIAYQGKPTTLYATTFNTVTNFMTPAMHGMANTYYLMVENPETGDNAGLVFYDNSDPFMALYGQYTVVEGSMGMTTPDTPSLIADWSYSNFTIDGNIYYPLRGTITVDTTMAMLGTDDANALTFDLVVVDEDYNEVSLVGYCEFGPFGYGPSYIDINLNTWGFTNFVVSYDETDSNLVTLKSSSITNGDLVLNLTTENGEVAGVYDVNDNNLAGYYFDSLDAVDYNITSGRIMFTKVEGSENEWELFISDRAGDWVFGDKYKVAVPEQTATYIVTLEFPEPEVIGIATAADLVAFAAAVNAGDYTAWVDPADGEVNVLAELDMTGVAWTPISSFNGVFDGGNHAIKNWTTSRGLFVNNTGTVKNVVIDKSCTLTLPTITADSVLGFVVDNNTGVVSGCENNANITFSTSATLAVQYKAGAIVGYSSASAQITNCTNNGNITIYIEALDGAHTQYFGGIVGNTSMSADTNVAVDSCTNNGDISVTINGTGDNMYLGGVSGACNNKGTINSCKNTGKISFDHVAGGSGAYPNIGGIVGYAAAYINGCSNEGAVSFTTDGSSVTRPAVAGIAGYVSKNVTNCNNTGDITAEGTKFANASKADAAGAGGEKNPVFGGIAGCVGNVANGGTADIEDCTNRGNITIVSPGATLAKVGGIVGEPCGNVINCDNYGNIDATIGKQAYVGGIVGFYYLAVDKKMEDCTNEGNIVHRGGTEAASAFHYVGGLIATFTNPGGVDKFYTINCENKGEVKSVADLPTLIGGCFGTLRGTARNTNNYGTVTSEGNHNQKKSAVAGFAAFGAGSIDNCGSYGDVTLDTDITTDLAASALVGTVGGTAVEYTNVTVDCKVTSNQLIALLVAGQNGATATTTLGTAEAPITVKSTTTLNDVAVTSENLATTTIAAFLEEANAANILYTLGTTVVVE